MQNHVSVTKQHELHRDPPQSKIIHTHIDLRQCETLISDTANMPFWTSKCSSEVRIPTLLLSENSRTFSGLSRTPETFFVHTAHALLNLFHMASSTASTLDQVHCTQRCNTRMIWNAKYFKIYRHFVSVNKSPNLALCTLVNLNHN